MAISIHIETDNSAFGETAHEKAIEVAKILEGIVERILDNEEVEDMKLKDSSGNTVGELFIDE